MFPCKGERLGKEVRAILYHIGNTPIERHVKVKGEASPHDPSLREYWDKRHQKAVQSVANPYSMGKKSKPTI